MYIYACKTMQRPVRPDHRVMDGLDNVTMIPMIKEGIIFGLYGPFCMSMSKQYPH